MEQNMDRREWRNVAAGELGGHWIIGHRDVDLDKLQLAIRQNMAHTLERA